jgi:gamma-glutamyltranspeptidase/glutathione hydrolase
MPLPSSGGLLLAQMLRMASFENLEKYQQNSTKAVQVMTEAERRAFADRAEYMGDPDFIQDKTSYLISDEYLKNRWKSFSFDKATQVRRLENHCTTQRIDADHSYFRA